MVNGDGETETLERAGLTVTPEGVDDWAEFEALSKTVAQ